MKIAKQILVNVCKLNTFTSTSGITFMLSEQIRTSSTFFICVQQFTFVYKVNNLTASNLLLVSLLPYLQC